MSKPSMTRPTTFEGARSKSGGRSHRQSIVFDSTEKRFKQKGLTTYIHQHGTNNNVGPGSYALKNMLLKKSFNMSGNNNFF
jgi:hypothetical protein